MFARGLRVAPAVLLGLSVVAAARLLTLPECLWEQDEFLFAQGVVRFDPLLHHPHPPGYPLLIGLGKLVNLLFNDPFRSLVALSVVSSLIGFLALADAFRRFAGEGEAAQRIGVVGALLFHLSPAMLVHGPLALSDSPALMFLSLALAAISRLPGETARPALALGVFSSAAIGCRPQLAVVLLPMLAVALVFEAAWRRRILALAAFTAASLAWFLPLLAAVGWWPGFLAFLGKQAGFVSKFDAELARAAWSPAQLVARFVAAPWGAWWAGSTVLALAALGLVVLVRRRRWLSLPLFVLAGLHVAFCLAVMEPQDGVRYALPSVVAVAFAAAVGLEAIAARLGRPGWAWLPATALAAAFGLYAGPLLVLRSTHPSPPVQAVAWAKDSLPARSIFLVEPSLEAHAEWFLQKYLWSRASEGLDRFAGKPGRPVYLLADGESRWPGAVTFSWPPLGAYGRLTRNHYRIVSISPLPNQLRFETLHGVYSYEPSLREPGWRWLDREATIRVFPRKSREVAMTLALSPLAPWPENSVTVTAGGGGTASVSVPRGFHQRVLLALPRQRAVDIDLRSASSFVPAEVGANTSDRRRLAVQLLSVELLEL